MSTRKLFAALLASAFYAVAAHAAWVPEKPVEFIVTSGAGGGTDIFARTVQAIVIKHKLMEAPIVVVNKGGGAGSEGYVYATGEPTSAYRLVFGTNNEYLLPFVAKMGYSPENFVPLAAMVMDDLLLWVNSNSPYKDAKSFIEAARKGGLKMGGSQSKDVDQTLVEIISEATGAKFTYIPFKSGGEAAVQLAGGHIDSNTNNPSENLGQWKAGMVRPLCVFSPQRMAKGAKVTKDMSWSDIPTCSEAGLTVGTFQMPRTVWLPAGAAPEALAFYTAMMAKVQQTPEWKAYVERTSQTDTFVTGEALRKYITDDMAKSYGVYKRAGWLGH